VSGSPIFRSFFIFASRRSLLAETKPLFVDAENQMIGTWSRLVISLRLLYA